MMVWLSVKINMPYSMAREETKARRPIRKRRKQNIVAVKEKKKNKIFSTELRKIIA